MAKLSLPEHVRETVIRRYGNQQRTWLLGAGEWPLTLSLGSPTEKDVAADPAGVRRWVDAWRDWRGTAEVSWTTRLWPRMGTQQVPRSISFASAADVAQAAGEGERWATAITRSDLLAARWPALQRHPLLARHFNVLADYEESDFTRLVSMLDWLERNPASGYTIRQLPVEGLDTKWLEKRKGVVADFLRVLREPAAESEDFYTLCGLSRTAHRIRLRILCPALRARVGGLCDIEAPVAELARLELAPSRTIIVENLETGLALPDMAGTVSIMRLGNAVAALSALPWLRNCRTVYWGDLDTFGFAILNRARAALPGLTSAMMEAHTLLRHRPLWGEEPVQCSDLELPHLNAEERVVWTGLKANTWGTRLRLEQERIPWEEALASLHEALKAHE